MQEPQIQTTTPTIAIVTGEASGDLLGADLIRSLRQHYPNGKFIGIPGPNMLKEGCQPLASIDELSVLGFIEILRRLPQILMLRRRLSRYFIQNPPDVFIGIDSPEFNLDLELNLKEHGIRTVHYVSPSVWAWRKGRIKKIKRAVDLLLTLFPFENKFYDQHQVPVKFVGHPLADQIPLETSQDAARKQLNLITAPAEQNAQQKWVALLPGSRVHEVELLAPIFLRAAKLCLQQQPQLHFLIAAVNDKRYKQLEQLCTQDEFKNLPLQIIQGNAQTVIGAADAVLAASGTVTLEVLLVKRPLVIAYCLAPITWWIAKKIIKQPIGLPNLLAGYRLVPEFLQNWATPEALSHALLDYLTRPELTEPVITEYTTIHHQLRLNASEQAAAAIQELLKRV
jgi:lipid-A-disaccharide synthase